MDVIFKPLTNLSMLLRNVRISSPNFEKKPTNWITLITLLSYQMTSSCICRIVALLFPILSVPSPPGFSMFSYPTLPYPPCTYSHMFPVISCVYSSFYYFSHWSPVPEMAGKRKSNFTPRLFLMSYVLNIKGDYLNNTFHVPTLFWWARGIGTKFVLSLG